MVNIPIREAVLEKRKQDHCGEDGSEGCGEGRMRGHRETQAETQTQREKETRGETTMDSLITHFQ